jgi:hypothetical protein
MCTTAPTFDPAAPTFDPAAPTSDLTAPTGDTESDYDSESDYDAESDAVRRIQARARHYILQLIYAGLADEIELGWRCYMSADHYMKSLYRLGTARLPRAPANSGTFSIWARKMAAIDRIQAHARHYILQSIDAGIADDVKLALYCGEAAGSYRPLLERLGTARLGTARLPKALRRP